MTALIEVMCACCGEMRSHVGRSLCNACWKRHDKAGTLDEFPRLRTWTSTLGRIADYAELRERRMPIRAAAELLGVTSRTAERYEARIKAATA